jgi:uncharacterized protein involved in exopolysaccharide biosynthesis
MTEQVAHNDEDDEISLLDILVTLAESWKLLVFGPLIAAVLAGGLSFLSPKTFESVAIVRLTEQELALINSAPVQDLLIEKFGLLQEFGGIQDDARQYLSKKVVGKLKSYCPKAKTKTKLNSKFCLTTASLSTRQMP